MAEENKPADVGLQVSTVIEDTPATETSSSSFPYRLAWDDENIDYNFKSRTKQAGWPANLRFPPAVLRYYPVMKEKAGTSEWILLPGRVLS